MTAATAAHSVVMMFRKETAFPCWRAIDRRWNKNVVALESSVMTVMRRPISCNNSIAMSFHVPAVSMAIGQKMCVLTILAYFEIFCCAAWSAAGPGVLRMLAILCIRVWKSDVPCQRFAFSRREVGSAVRAFVVLYCIVWLFYRTTQSFWICKFYYLSVLSHLLLSCVSKYYLLTYLHFI